MCGLDIFSAHRDDCVALGINDKTIVLAIGKTTLLLLTPAIRAWGLVVYPRHISCRNVVG